VMLQGRQRVLCEIGERALRLRFFLVFRDVLLMIRDHRLYELLIELGAGELAETIVIPSSIQDRTQAPPVPIDAQIRVASSNNRSKRAICSARSYSNDTCAPRFPLRIFLQISL
jgi:hypothetical protein